MHDMIELPLPPDSLDDGTDMLRVTLLESRQRWRQFTALATDLAFETDEAGLITFLAPEFVLGWPAQAFVGHPARELLLQSDAPDPFAFTAPVRLRNTWFRTADGTPACLALTTTPMLDDAGRHQGIRGIGTNVTERQRAEAATAAALRRAEVLDHILVHMRQEVLAPRMMRAVLDGLLHALGAEGCGVLDRSRPEESLVMHAVGAEVPFSRVLPFLHDGEEGPTGLTLDDGTGVLFCTCSTRFGVEATLVAMRDPGSRPWDEDDLMLAASITGVVRIVLEHESIQRELARQARTDPLTGLLNRRAFLEEANRRLDRLEREQRPATMIFIDLDRLKQLNDRLGHEAGDSALLLVGALLHRTVRPTDLVARLGGDEFAVWLDGADSLTAAERAEALRIGTPQELAHLTAEGCEPMGMSIGIATREPGDDETVEQLLNRADQAMYTAKHSGRGHWLVAQRPGCG